MTAIAIIGAVCLLVGFFIGHLAASSPAGPRCSALLSTGDRCMHREGHEEPHFAYIGGPGIGAQAFHWPHTVRGVHHIQRMQ